MKRWGVGLRNPKGSSRDRMAGPVLCLPHLVLQGSGWPNSILQLPGKMALGGMEQQWAKYKEERKIKKKAGEIKRTLGKQQLRKAARCFNLLEKEQHLIHRVCRSLYTEDHFGNVEGQLSLSEWLQWPL